MKAAAKKHPAPDIRPAGREDASAIRALAQSIWPVCFAGVIEPHMIENMLERIYSVESLHEQMREGHRFWLAAFEGAPAGYVSAYKEGDAIWLKKLYCEPALQGGGIGGAMYRTAVAAFMPAAEVRLLVNRENAQAQAWYGRMGFERIREVPVMMGDFAFVDYLYSKRL